MQVRSLCEGTISVVLVNHATRQMVKGNSRCLCMVLVDHARSSNCRMDNVGGAAVPCN